MGVVTMMKNVVEYYIPDKFRKPSARWISHEKGGKIIPFTAPQKKSA
jgi:hypothetical protein